MTSPPAGSRSKLARAALLVALAVLIGAFGATRIAMYRTIPPILDADSYKYLAGADSLSAGSGWPPVFLKLHNGGGALHAVPGYAWFMLAIWKLAGVPVLSGVVLAQSLLSLVALGATIDLVRRWHGLAAAVMAAALLVSSPALAWIDQLLMPEAVGAAVLAIAIWLAAVMPTTTIGGRTLAAAIGCGVLMSAAVLLRTSAQVFVPFPLLLAVLRIARARGSLRSIAGWTLVYAAAFAVPLLPWIAHNHAVHGRWVLSASTGRNLYFSGVWSNTIDRQAEMDKFHPGKDTDVESSYDLLDLRMQSFIDSGMDIADADAAMQRLALAGYRSAGLERYLAGRAAILAGLFEEESFGRQNMTLYGHLDWYLTDGFGRDVMRNYLESRWKYHLSPALDQTLREGHASHPGPHVWIHWWVRRLLFDDAPLAIAFLAATLVLLLAPRRNAPPLVAWVLPTFAYLFVYTIFGAPLYRYQATIHAPMLTVIAVAAGEFVSGLRRRAASGAVPVLVD
ncbi:MAG TPA: hypothetical protein VN634_16375 [Candidatus Limnocylindrales bacterium]|nr:hypothetical protein [Candidatus Limnocylindrales bacterium]